MLAPRSRALDSTIWARVSKSGGSIGTDNPDARRDFSRGSRPSTSRGKRSQVMMICCLPSNNALKVRSEEHTSELQSLMRISYAVFCLKKQKHYLCAEN